jgi:putative adenylate-forming enzyme
MRRLAWLLIAYWRARRVHFSSRAELDAYQSNRLRNFFSILCARSNYFAPFKELALADWPIMDKATMIANFDVMNTAGLTLTNVMAVAMSAENSRDFSPTIGNVTVGLSSGTSSQRGIFAVTAKEKAQWAGVMLAKALPDGLFYGERVALLLRANSNLYTAVRTPWLSFEFFDLFKPIDHLTETLALYRPTIIVAPAQVLRHIALAVIDGKVRLAPKRVISVAEVLDSRDRDLIMQVFGSVHEIYQATEGFLASTCAKGVLHLNEEYVHIEPHWLDEQRRKFVPVITDFSRMTQPIVKYRLDDVLVARETPCSCGRVTRAIERIEGRCDDMLILPAANGGHIPVFSDVLSRGLAQILPADADYRMVQNNEASLTLSAAIGAEKLDAACIHLSAILQQLGVDVKSISWTLCDSILTFDPTAKRRRITRHTFAAEINFPRKDAIND